MNGNNSQCPTLPGKGEARPSPLFRISPPPPYVEATGSRWPPSHPPPLSILPLRCPAFLTVCIMLSIHYRSFQS